MEEVVGIHEHGLRHPRNKCTWSAPGIAQGAERMKKTDKAPIFSERAFFQERQTLYK